IYRPEYGEHATLFVWLMAAAAVAYASAVLGYAANATRAYKLMTLPYGAVLLVTLAACWLLVPQFGLNGAAWSVGLCGFVSCIAALWILIRARSGKSLGPIAEGTV